LAAFPDKRTTSGGISSGINVGMMKSFLLNSGEITLNAKLILAVQKKLV
jgi:hypothetical protein